jgi:hypothetical protein
MLCVLELTAMKFEVVSLPPESIKDSLSTFYELAYDLLLGLHDVKRQILLHYVYIYIYIMCVCINTQTYTHLDIDRLSSWKIEVGC